MEEHTAAAHTHAQTQREELAACLRRTSKGLVGEEDSGLPVEEGRPPEAGSRTAVVGVGSQSVVEVDTVVVVVEVVDILMENRFGAARNLGEYRLQSSFQFHSCIKAQVLLRSSISVDRL